MIIGLVLWRSKQSQYAARPGAVGIGEPSGNARARRARARSAVPTHLRGEVVTSTPPAQGLAGATVCAVEPGPLQLPIACTPTAADGTFAIIVPPGGYWLQASALGFVPGFHLAPGALTPSVVHTNDAGHVSIRLAVGGVPLRGNITDINGGIIAGARVTVRTATSGYRVAAQPAPMSIVESDQRGRFDATVPPGTVAIRVTAPGYVAREFTATAPNEQVALVLIPGSTLGGTVRDHRGQPVADAQVMLQRSHLDTDDPTAAQAIITDLEGRFVFTEILPGSYRPYAVKGGHWGEVAQPVALGLTQAITDVEITMQPGGSLTLRPQVGIGSSARPCRVADITVMAADGTHAARATPQDDGSLFVAGLMAPSYRITHASCSDGYWQASSLPIAISPDGATTSHIVQFLPGGAVRGRIMPAKGELHLSLVPAHGAAHPVAVAHDGSFAITNVPPGTYQMRVVADVGEPPTPAPQIEIRAGQTVERDITLATQAEVTVRVETPQGQPRAGVVVYGEPMASTTNEQTAARFALPPTSPAGTTLVGLPPGRYRFATTQTARKPGAATNKGSRDTAAPPPRTSAEVEIVGTEAHAVVLEIPATAQATLKGNVIDSNGQPVGDAFIYAAPSTDEGPRTETVRADDGAVALTNPDGTFEVPAEAGHTYTVHATRKNGAQSANVEASVQGPAITLQLLAGSEVRGRVVDERGKPVTMYTRRLTSQHGEVAPTDTVIHPNGEFRLAHIPAGPYTLTVDVEGFLVETPLEVKREQPTEIPPIIVPFFHHVIAKLVDARSGAPVVGMRVIGQKYVPGDRSFSSLQSSVSDARGMIYAAGIPAGELRFFVRSGNPTHARFDFHRPLPTNTAKLIDLGTIPVAPLRVLAGQTAGDLGIEIITTDAGATLGAVTDAEALRAGLRPGAQIATVDGVDVRGWRGYLAAALATVPAGSTVRFELTTGQAATVTARPVATPSQP